MRAFAWLRSRPRAVASAAVLSAVAVAITTMAFVYDGFPTTEVDLHDGGEIVFEGTPADLVSGAETLTAQHLRQYVGA